MKLTHEVAGDSLHVSVSLQINDLDIQRGRGEEQ